jgi:hydrogenase maturation protein HypF
MQRHVTIIVSGIVQGIGFRPFCSRLAGEIGLGGSVRNTAEGVLIDLFGSPEGVLSYIQRLQTDCPALGHIQSIEILEDEPSEKPFCNTFEILQSGQPGENLTLIPPDIATCEDCLSEIKDPGDRRFRYPFTNCTNCGPRFSIIEALPYDRPLTAMSGFPMCSSCMREYSDPSDRRYHAQPVACETCGPSVSLLLPDRTVEIKGDKAIRECVALLKRGSIGAIKGLGGFHIACLPEDAVLLELRKRKRRPHKPFALMIRDEGVAEGIVCLTSFSRLLLNSPRRPIVICPRKPGASISGHVAPEQDSLGVMLPYTPLHHLVMEEVPVLIMTSANLSDEPVISDNQEALEKLGNIADFFLMHDRPISMKIDDSVVAPAGKTPVIIRRARGYVPHPILTKRKMPQILAAGAEMKSTFSLTRDQIIYSSQYLGDLKQLDTAVYYEKTLDHFLKLFGLRPKLLAADLHPSYACTAIAGKVMGGPDDTLLVQHHHAHMAACLAENGFDGPAIGIILDGTGLGPDRKVWGGEFLLGDFRSFTRAGHFREAPLPGGDRAVLEPWRFALALLSSTYGSVEAEDLANKLWPDLQEKIKPVLATLDRSPVTTSSGRLFDAVSALTGIREVVTYDGQAAMELESASKGSGIITPFRIDTAKDPLVLDWGPAIRWIVEEGLPMGRGRVAAAFHLGLAVALTDIAMEISERHGIRTVVLSGGVWQNRRLLSLTLPLLRKRGLKPLVHRSLAPNDECISIGQAAIAASHWDKGRN